MSETADEFYLMLAEAKIQKQAAEIEDLKRELAGLPPAKASVLAPALVLAAERDEARAQLAAVRAESKAEVKALTKRVADLERQVDELENALLEASEAMDR